MPQQQTPGGQLVEGDDLAAAGPRPAASRPAVPERPERRVVRSTGFVPREAKLHAPIARDGLIFRGELVDRLRESAATPVVLVTGPPGYGKTTALAQWAEEDERPAAWLSLDQGDNDPVVFVTYLMLALQRIEPVDSGVLAALTGGDVAVSTVMIPRLGRMLRRRQQPFLLVVDDAHVLTDPAALEVLYVVAENLPEGSQVAVAGRQSPDLPWHTLRVSRRLFDVGLDDLRLTAAESRALLEASGLDLARQDVSALLERTEGWAAGLYLGVLSLRSRSHGDVIPAFAGDDNVVASYLRDELLDTLSPEQQTFFLRMSLLDRVCGALCDAVLGTTGSGQLLQQLEQSNLFVLPLDHHSTWYRFHPLFAEMLRAEEQRREPAMVRGIHSRASRWLEEAGDAEASIRHAQAAGETGRAAWLVWSQVAYCLDTGQTATLERWIDSFTNTEVVAHARLALTAAWVAVVRGRPVEHWVAAADRGAYDAGRSGEAEAVASAVALLRARLAQHGVVRMGADARLAARLQAPDDPWRCLASYLIGVSLHLSGHRPEALARLKETESLAEAMGMRAPRALAVTQLAVMAVEDNDWQRADGLVADAIALLEHGSETGPAVASVYCLSTLLKSRNGLADEARLESRRSLRIVALNAQFAPWDAVQSRWLLARANLMLGDTAAARVLMSEAQGLLTGVPDAVVLRGHLDDVWQQLEHSPLGQAGGLTTLTTAELRVLQYLPTHLSFEQISQRLFVSRNTVKTQAIAAYRKLGVTSRAEAVERAYALGLVQV